MIKKQTIYQGVCDECGAKLTDWNDKSAILNILKFQNRSMVVNGKTKNYCPFCWEKLMKEADNGQQNRIRS